MARHLKRWHPDRRPPILGEAAASSVVELEEILEELDAPLQLHRQLYHQGGGWSRKARRMHERVHVDGAFQVLDAPAVSAVEVEEVRDGESGKRV